MVAARKKAAISTSARTGSAMLQEVAAGALDVLPDLIRELQRGAELMLAPKQSVEVEAHRVAVNVRVEIQDVALDGGRVILVERRPHADVRHAGEGAVEALEAGRGHVHGAAGKELVEGIHVHGRKADFSSEL